MTDDLRAWLAARNWELTQASELCWLDHPSPVPPGYRKEWTDRQGETWEIFLCLEDAAVLERGAFGGDYRGALTPPDSRAQEWPWLRVDPFRVAGL